MHFKFQKEARGIGVCWRIALTTNRLSRSLPCRSEALTKAFPLTPRDTDVSWSLRNPEAGRLLDDQSKTREEKQ
jgi:hypothetical protein